jgi:hypothetical protein
MVSAALAVRHGEADLKTAAKLHDVPRSGVSKLFEGRATLGNSALSTGRIK